MKALDPLEIPLTGTLLIEASAGTGKTYTIGSLYLRLLLERKLSVEQILVVTFTNAATEELRARVRQRIFDGLQVLRGAQCCDEFFESLLKRTGRGQEIIALLSGALINIDQASIFTIHQFCQRMLKENAFESGTWFETEFVTGDFEYLTAIIEDFWRREFYPSSAGLAQLVRSEWSSPEYLLQTMGEYLRGAPVKIIPKINQRDVSVEAYRQALSAIENVWAECRDEIIELLYSDTGLSRKQDGYKHENLDVVVADWSIFLGQEAGDYEFPSHFKLFCSQCLSQSLKPTARKKGATPPQHVFFDLCQRALDICEDKKKQIISNAIEYCRAELKSRKQLHQIMSFDDLIANLNEALCGKSSRFLAEKIARQFPAALIDEFQDTDLSQYEIFRSIYRRDSGKGLFLIGDPKQAIYSFRGGDIFTYMKARRDVDSTANIYSLGQNWRASRRLVEAINEIFGSARAPFLFEGEIDFRPVKAGLQSDQAPLFLDGRSPEPMRIWFVEKTAFNQHQGKVTKKWAQQSIAEAYAAEIKRLLCTRNFIGEDRIESKDIAILVRDKYEARIIRQSLAAAGLDSAFISRDSVFETEEAELLYIILAAVVDFENPNYVRSALATKLVEVNANDLEELSHHDNAWQKWLDLFRYFHELWSSRNFMVMFHSLIHQLGIVAKVMNLDQSERRMTNLLHLGELLQVASQNQSSMEFLLRWFNEQRLKPDGNSEDQQLRLESDRDLITVVTIHKSKGLEYPVVIAPFLWGRKKTASNPPFSFHDPDDRSACIELGSKNLKQHRNLMLREKLAEELRLVYVALTRAKYLCYFAWGNINGASESALSYLLCQPDELRNPLTDISKVLKASSDEELLKRLNTLSENAQGKIAVSSLSSPDRFDRFPVEQPVQPSPQSLGAKKFKGNIDFGWRMTSYSQLMSLSVLPDSFRDHDAIGAISEQHDVDVENQINEIFRFPRGARAGSFMHELLENLDFPTASGETLTKTVSLMLAKHGFNEDQWQSVTENLVANVLDATLDDKTGLSLRKLSNKQRLVELKFYFPLKKLNSRRFNRLVKSYYKYPANLLSLEFDKLRGIMQGYIDLVFEWEGRYFVVDYKSNHLGNQLDDYGSAKLWPAILEHRYDLQYLIYTTALHRYLNDRLPNYQYQRHFGGVYYLFLRGMDANRGADSGVFFDLPDYGLIRDLDLLFSGQTA